MSKRWLLTPAPLTAPSPATRGRTPCTGISSRQPLPAPARGRPSSAPGARARRCRSSGRSWRRVAAGALKLRGLFARHNPNNGGSGRVLEKLGFGYTHDELMPHPRSGGGCPVGLVCGCETCCRMGTRLLKWGRMTATGPSSVRSWAQVGGESGLFRVCERSQHRVGPRSGFIYSFSATHALAEGSGHARRHKR